MEATTIRLSQEEVLFILGAVNTESIPGLGLPADLVDTATFLALREAGGRALIVRDLLVPSGEGYTLDKGLYTIAIICTRPDQLVSLAIELSDEPVRQSFYYRVPELAVTHQPEGHGTHRFTLSQSSDMGAHEALTALNVLPKTSPPLGDTWTLPQSTLAEAENRASAGGDGAAVLREVGLEAGDAADLAQTLAAPSLNLVVQLAAQIRPIPNQTILRVVAGPGGCWMAEGESLTDATLELRRSSADLAQDLVSVRFALLGAR